MGKDLNEFTRISIFRMCEHYLPKLRITLDNVENEVLWKHEVEHLNSIGGIVLHVGQHIQRHIVKYSINGSTDGGIENYFPDEAQTSAAELIQIITERFNSWREVMTDYIEGNKDLEKLDSLMYIIWSNTRDIILDK
ncbi:hypothetical protein [Paenibacillus sp. BC26]|uniref:hypothetical protein n=1 Tax=Paenibacillus sp. BC26 TaxID=1881032 RepID=UPI0008E3D629|nr:hypothetical protein [Paenibacillus sp. BC26]SFS77516.1 hypothetical protein SAMN05428962_2789 [Paenibacillus sp. BC26]